MSRLRLDELMRREKNYRERGWKMASRYSFDLVAIPICSGDIKTINPDI